MRALTREDLRVLNDKRVGPPRVKQLRETHRRLAMFVAAGFPTGEIVEVTGYSTTRVLQLKADPAFKQLVSELQPQADAANLAKIDEFRSLLFENAVKAERMIGEHLDRVEETEDADLIPIKSLLAISRDSADRIGHGKASTTVNKVVDFAKMMEQAQAYSGKGNVIDAPSRRLDGGSKPAGDGTHPQTNPQPSQAELAAVPGIRRRL